MTHPIDPLHPDFRLAVGIVIVDEFHCVKKTIESAMSLSDNIYILDLVDDETTRQAIDSFGLKERCLISKNTTDHAAARNELIEKIQSAEQVDWVLWMKNGEFFDETTRDGFRKFISEHLDRGTLYVMISRRLIDPEGGRHDMDEETIEPRLMPLGKGLHFIGRIAESLYPVASGLMIPLSAAPGRFLCPSKYLPPQQQQERGMRNLRLIGQLIEEDVPIKEEYLSFQAAAKSDLGDYPGARADLLKLISETTKTNIRLESYYDLWETLVLAPESPEETTRLLLKALDHFPVDMQLLTFMGMHLQRIGKLDLAVRTFQTAMQHGRISLDVWHRLHLREIAVVSLALAHRLRGENHEAIRILEGGMDQIEDLSEYARHLLDLYIAEFQELKAHELAAVLWGDERLDRMREVLTGACRASAGASEAAVLPLEAAYMNGCRDILCLRWYSLTLLSLRRFEDAISVIRQWVQADPAGSEARAYLQAAMNPDRFGEIIGQMRRSQLELLGVDPDADQTASEAVREMVDASGKSRRGLIGISAFGTEPTGGGFDFDGFEIESDDQGPSELVIRTKER